jgi:hypothetical protein
MSALYCAFRCCLLLPVEDSSQRLLLNECH